MATATEYGLIAAMVAVSIIAGVAAFGPSDSKLQQPEPTLVAKYDSLLSEQGSVALSDKILMLVKTRDCHVAAGDMNSSYQVEEDYLAAATVFNQQSEGDFTLGIPTNMYLVNPMYREAFAKQCHEEGIVP